jgi:hypothetical protein
MATISLTIPSAIEQRVLTAVSETVGYNPETDGTQIEFVEKYLSEHLTAITRQFEINNAIEEGKELVEDAATKADTEIIIAPTDEPK